MKYIDLDSQDSEPQSGEESNVYEKSTYKKISSKHDRYIASLDSELLKNTVLIGLKLHGAIEMTLQAVISTLMLTDAMVQLDFENMRRQGTDVITEIYEAAFFALETIAFAIILIIDTLIELIEAVFNGVYATGAAVCNGASYVAHSIYSLFSSNTNQKKNAIGDENQTFNATP